MKNKIVRGVIVITFSILLVGCSTQTKYWETLSSENTKTIEEIQTEIPVPTNTFPLPTLTTISTLTPTSVPELLKISEMSSGLYIVSMSSKDDRIIVRNIQGEFIGDLLNHALQATINPQKTLLAYQSMVPTSSQLDLFGPEFAFMNLDSGQIIPIEMDDNEFGYGNNGSWSPDGKRIIINVLGEWFSPRLGLIDVSTSEYSDIPLWEGEASYPDWSPDGKTIAFQSGYYFDDLVSSAIYLLNASCFEQMDTCTENVLELFSEKGKGYYHPSWSPDNKFLVFGCTDESQNNGDLCVGDIQSKEIRKLTNTDSSEGSPDWSPDGEWITYTDTYDIYIIKPDGSNNHFVAENEKFLFWLEIP